ncbi:hypothetical protein [Streptomyces boninensis]|uniref:hypothetical protein n=1 Tax=Streptomyces boninensis TaxID=2039455 RepID=UPI003B21EF93
MNENPPTSSHTFFGQEGSSHDLVPSSVIAAVPAARAEAEEASRALRLNFLDDASVLWMLEQRQADQQNAGSNAAGCLSGLLISVAGIGGWAFWDLVAAEKPKSFQIAAIAGPAVLAVLGLVILVWAMRREVKDRTRVNARVRARAYRKIVAVARKGGADIPRMYPYYGLYATSRTFHPDAPEAPGKPEAGRSYE